RARVMTDLPGEMNLFVIRQVALRNNLQQEIIRALRDHYRILLVKDIPFLTRQMRSKGMRGGKWRRGGKPCIAVVVFDPHPAPTTAEDRKVHPFVFNSRQFMKRELREWFTRVTGEKASQNPIHSTDNEAEAAGHFPLFFSAHEQEDIFDRLARM